MSDERENAQIEKWQLPKFPSGAQMHQQRAEVKRQVVNIVEDLKLRQWCVERSIESLGKIGTISPPSYLEEITRVIYDFITNKGGDDAKST